MSYVGAAVGVAVTHRARRAIRWRCRRSRSTSPTRCRATGAAKAWRLASDTYDTSLPGGYSSHGDWFNGWKEEFSDAWHADCVTRGRDCHAHLLGDGAMMY